MNCFFISCNEDSLCFYNILDLFVFKCEKSIFFGSDYKDDFLVFFLKKDFLILKEIFIKFRMEI